MKKRRPVGTRPPEGRRGPAVIDELRKGPRAVAVTNAGITTDDDGTVTAEVTLPALSLLHI